MALNDRSKIVDTSIESEMKTSYIDYSMSVIVSRALPDVRDGLKPSQRRILVAMNDLNLAPGRPYRKCAKIAGDTSGNYHPHGEQVVYPTLVRLAQNWNMRYPLVDGQGNFGCFTGDTRIKLLDGTDRSFAELAELGPDATFHVYSVDASGRIVVGQGRNARITRRAAALVEVELDNGARIRCTPDHRFRLRDNSYKPAIDLTSADSLMACETGSGSHRDAPLSSEPALREYAARKAHDVAAAFAVVAVADEPRSAPRAMERHVIRVRRLAEAADVYDITVDEHHNFLLADGVFVHNSIDGDAPAAMRYTEARLTPLAMEMLGDLEKNTVDFRPNYDETREEPTVLPGVVPNLMINGCSGIAVGMTTEVPPHNLGEICDAIVHVIDHPEAAPEDLLKIVSGPDFPTGGIIYGGQGIRDCYLTGRGLIKVRAKVQVEEGKAGRMSLVATEIPFQVNKGALLERIAELVRDGKVVGISDLRDESDRDGMRIVVELKKDANPKVVLNQLFVHSPLQVTFGAIMLGLVNQRPQVLTLRGLVDQYVLHRQIVVRRRTEYDLAEAEKRAHILEGLKIALDHLDAVIALIRASKDVETARTGLMQDFKLSEIQASAILEMRLARLTALERSKVEQEYLELIQLIESLRSILASPQKMLAIIQDEVRRLKEKYGDPRRTQIMTEEGDIGYEDTIEQKDMVITISHAGYIKRQEISSYRSQRRGGKGVIGARTREEDYLEHLFIANTHAYLLFLTDRGRCYWLKVHEVEQAGRMARGRPLVNHLEGLSREERVQAVVAVKEFDDQHFLVCATKKGLIKKTVLAKYSRPLKGGIKAILLEEGDALIEAIVSDGTHDMILAKKKGLAVRFHESEVRATGRTSYGVKAATLDEEGDEVVSLVGVKRQATLLTVCENGYGKRSEISEYRLSHRGGKGIITIKTTERNGDVVAVKEVVDGDELMIITRSGQLIRMPVRGISVIGRVTQGVKLVNLAPAEGELVPDTVAGVTRVVNEDEEGAAAIAVGANGAETEGNGAEPEATGEAGAPDEGGEEAPEE